MNSSAVPTVLLKTAGMLSAAETKTQPLAKKIARWQIAVMEFARILKINSFVSWIAQPGPAAMEFVKIQANHSEVAQKIALLKIAEMNSATFQKISESAQRIVGSVFALKTESVKLSKNPPVLIALLATTTDDVNQMKSPLNVPSAIRLFIPSLSLSSTMSI